MLMLGPTKAEIVMVAAESEGEMIPEPLPILRFLL